MDYTNRIIVDTSTGVAAVDKLGNSLEATGQKMAALGSSVVKVAADGVKEFTRSATEATQAARAMPGALASGMNAARAGAKGLAQEMREAKRAADQLAKAGISVGGAASAGADKMQLSYRRARKGVQDLDKASKKAASGGSKDLTRGIIEATRAAQDFHAAGMMGISNNIIEIGARFGKFGVIAGAVLTAVALSWDAIARGISDFASRNAVGKVVDQFKRFGSEVGNVFKGAMIYVDKFFDATLGENAEKSKKDLSLVETGVRKVELALSKNREEQEKLTSAQELDAEQIARLNQLRKEETGHLKEKERLLNLERLREEYGERASEDQVANAESFKKAFGGDAGKKLFDVYGQFMGEGARDDLLATATEGKVSPEQLSRMLDEVAARKTLHKDFSDAEDHTGLQEALKDFRLLKEGKDPKAVRDSERAIKNAMPIFMGTALGGAFGVQDVSAREFATGVREMAPNLGPYGPMMADQATRMADPSRKAREVTAGMRDLADQVMSGPGGSKKARRQVDEMLEGINQADPRFDAEDDRAIGQLRQAVMGMIANAGSRKEREQAIVMLVDSLARSVQGDEVNSQNLQRRIGVIGRMMQQKSPPLGPSF